MTRHLVLAACAAAVALSGASLSAQTPAPDVPVVVTSGEGVVMAAPDRAFVGVTTESRASNPKDAQRKNAEIMRPVMDKLRALGLPPDAIHTTAIDLRMEYDFVDGRRVSRGYVAVNSIEVRVDNMERVGDVLDGAVTAGATSVSDIRFDVKDRAKLEREAVRIAVQDARARAEAAAAGAARTIDRILRIEEHGAVAPPTPMRPMMMMKAEAQAETPVSAGQMEFRARVTLTSALR